MKSNVNHPFALIRDKPKQIQFSGASGVNGVEPLLGGTSNTVEVLEAIDLGQPSRTP